MVIEIEAESLRINNKRSDYRIKVTTNLTKENN